MINIAFTTYGAAAIQRATAQAGAARSARFVSPTDLLGALLATPDNAAARRIVAAIGQDADTLLESLDDGAQTSPAAAKETLKPAPFTRLAIRVAMREAAVKGAVAVDTGDLLLGVLWVGGHGSVAELLPFDAARDAAASHVDPPARSTLIDAQTLDLFEPVSRGVLRVLEVARTHARQQGLPEVTTTEVLLALAADSEAAAAGILERLGVDYSRLADSARAVSLAGTTDDPAFVVRDFMSRPT